MVRHPSATSIHCGCRDGSRLTQVAYHLKEWLLGLTNIPHIAQPVVHLGVDIDGVLAVPWGIHLMIPYSLKVSGLSAWL